LWADNRKIFLIISDFVCRCWFCMLASRYFDWEVCRTKLSSQVLGFLSVIHPKVKNVQGYKIIFLSWNTRFAVAVKHLMCGIIYHIYWQLTFNLLGSKPKCSGIIIWSFSKCRQNYNTSFWKMDCLVSKITQQL
jgi:hypothetical protein